MGASFIFFVLVGCNYIFGLVLVLVSGSDQFIDVSKHVCPQKHFAFVVFMAQSVNFVGTVAMLRVAGLIGCQNLSSYLSPTANV